MHNVICHWNSWLDWKFTPKSWILRANQFKTSSWPLLSATPAHLHFFWQTSVLQCDICSHRFQENNNTFQASLLWTNQQIIQRKKSYIKSQLFLLLLIANVLKKVQCFTRKCFSTQNFTYNTEDTLLIVGYKLFIIFVIYLQVLHCHYFALQWHATSGQNMF